MSPVPKKVFSPAFKAKRVISPISSNTRTRNGSNRRINSDNPRTNFAKPSQRLMSRPKMRNIIQAKKLFQNFKGTRIANGL